MIKAIFFDWFNTLARYESPREELHSRVLREFGIEMSPSELMPGIMAADKYLFGENVLSPVEKRNPVEKTEVYINYNSLMLTETGVKVTKDLLLKILKKGQQLFDRITFVLFDDVLPTLRPLKGRKFIQGLLTNASKNIIPIQRQLGLESYLTFVVTSEEVRADKPNPDIFLAALERAGVGASEAVHIGDQYDLDVVGARAVGITPVLIDRYNLYPEVTDCPRIHTLPEVVEYL